MQPRARGCRHGRRAERDGLATPAGLEPATCRLEGGCSIQLSYGAGTERRIRPLATRPRQNSGQGPTASVMPVRHRDGGQGARIRDEAICSEKRVPHLLGLCRPCRTVPADKLLQQDGRGCSPEPSVRADAPPRRCGRSNSPDALGREIVRTAARSHSLASELGRWRNAASKQASRRGGPRYAATTGSCRRGHFPPHR